MDDNIVFKLKKRKLKCHTPLNLKNGVCDYISYCGCSVLGAILLVISLYSVLWGKSKEQSMDNNLGCLPVQAQTDRSTQVKETPVLSSNPRPSLSM